MSRQNGQNQQPDWGKFGLDSEKQPLNPGGNGSQRTPTTAQSGDAGTTNLFGGQIQHDNELFADDQVLTYGFISKLPVIDLYW